MATSTIKQVTNNSDNNYCKMLDGTLMQWGTITLTGSGPFYQLDFEQSFTNAANVQVTTETANVVFRVPSVTYNGATLMVISGTVPSEGSIVNWFAIGRWK